MLHKLLKREQTAVGLLRTPHKKEPSWKKEARKERSADSPKKRRDKMTKIASNKGKKNVRGLRGAVLAALARFHAADAAAVRFGGEHVRNLLVGAHTLVAGKQQRADALHLRSVEVQPKSEENGRHHLPACRTLGDDFHAVLQVALSAAESQLPRQNLNRPDESVLHLRGNASSSDLHLPQHHAAHP